jgi:mRNA interferase MazF
MKRAEIWWAEVDKRRPVVLLSRDEAYGVRALVIVAPVSTTVRGYPVEVRVGRREGLPRSGVINCDWLVTLPKERLLERAGSLTDDKRQRLDDALRFALGLDAP